MVSDDIKTRIRPVTGVKKTEAVAEGARSDDTEYCPPRSRKAWQKSAASLCAVGAVMEGTAIKGADADTLAVVFIVYSFGFLSSDQKGTGCEVESIRPDACAMHTRAVQVRTGLIIP